MSTNMVNKDHQKLWPAQLCYMRFLHQWSSCLDCDLSSGLLEIYLGTPSWCSRYFRLHLFSFRLLATMHLSTNACQIDWRHWHHQVGKWHVNCQHSIILISYNIVWNTSILSRSRKTSVTNFASNIVDKQMNYNANEPYCVLCNWCTTNNKQQYVTFFRITCRLYLYKNSMKDVTRERPRPPTSM